MSNSKQSSNRLQLDQISILANFSGFGEILSQKQDGKTTVIAYASRRLCKHERSMRNYSSMKLEFLCLHWAVTKKFRDYLYGTSSPFLVKTDSHPFSRILTTKHTAADMSKLADLSDFNFTIEYRSGKTNTIADALSRNPIDALSDDSDAEDEDEDDDACVINTQHELCVFLSERDNTILLPGKPVSAISDFKYSEEIHVSVHETSIKCVSDITDTDMTLLQTI